MERLERFRNTILLSSSEKIAIVKGLKDTELSHRNYSFSVGVNEQTIYNWRKKVRDGDTWGLMSQGEIDKNIKYAIDKTKKPRQAIEKIKEMGCRQTTASIKRKMIRLGVNFNREGTTTLSVRKARREHVKKLFSCGTWKSYQWIAETVGCSVNLVSTVANELGLAPKTRAGRNRSNIDDDGFDVGETVKIKKPTMNPMMAFALGIKL